MNLSPKLGRLLSAEQMERMEAGAMRVLDEVGYAVPEEVRPELARRPGVAIKEGRVTLSPKIVGDYLHEVRAKAAKVAPAAEARTKLSVGGWAEWMLAMETDEIRRPTTPDLIRSARLIDALHGEGVVGRTLGFPADVPILLKGLMQFKVCAEYNEHNTPMSGVTNIETADHLADMHRVMDVPLSHGLHVVSPLSMGGTEFDTAVYLARSGKIRNFSVGAMPMAGATAPIHFIGAFVQDIADAAGGAVILKLLFPEIEVSFGLAAYHFDMRAGNIIYGSPEDNLISLAVMDFNERYRGVRSGRHFCRTMAKRPGIQAAAEMAVSAAFGAMAGAPSFTGVGVLSLDEIHSDEQVALTIEVRDYVDRVKSGIEFGETELSVGEIIDAVRSGESYLGREETVRTHTRTCWYPRFLSRTVYAQSPGETDVELRARLKEFIRKKVAGHEYRLDAARRRELDRIYRKAERAVG